MKADGLEYVFLSNNVKVQCASDGLVNGRYRLQNFRLAQFEQEPQYYTK